MANVKISELPAATTLDEDDVLPVVVDGVTSKVTLAEFLAAADPATTADTSHIFVAADAIREKGFTAGSAVTATIPPNADVPFALGTRLRFHQYGAGQITVAGGSGVTVRTAATLKSRAQYSALEAVKIATNEWVLSGDLEL